MTASNSFNKAHSADFLPNLCNSLSVLLLVLAAELIALMLCVNNSRLPHLNWDLLAVYSFHIQWICLLSAFTLCRMRMRLREWSPEKAGLISYGSVLLITLITSLIGQFLLYFFSFKTPQLHPYFTVDIWQLVENLVVAGIIAGIALRYLYLQQQLRNQQEAELQARIQALQSRIRPHFLFNSMNSIASLIGSDPEMAERVIENLSELFRSSLAEPTLIPLEREINLCRHYLAIEQLRLGKRLQVEWNVTPYIDAIQIPSLMLQPLIENAIFHGIEPLQQGGLLSIKISQANNQLQIAISNPFPVAKKNSNPDQAKEKKHNKMALDNIRHRLRVHYGSASRLSSSSDNGVFTTYLFCPLKQE